MRRTFLLVAVLACAFSTHGQGTVTGTGKISGTGKITITPFPTVTALPASLAFGGVTQNTSSASQAVTLQNTGSTALTIVSIQLTAQYSLTSTCTNVLSGFASCVVNVTFSPTAVGSIPGTLTINDNAQGTPQTVTLTGTGLSASPPIVSLTPGSLSFGNQTQGTNSASQPVTLQNTGGANLIISSLTASSQYSQNNNCVSTLTSSASCTINVTFAPTNVGSVPGTITVIDNASGSPHTVTLSGTGTTPPVGGIFPTVGWTQMVGTKMSTVVPGYAEVQGNSGPAAVFTAWSGGTYDFGSYNRVANRFIHKGSGHGDWFGNEVYQLQMSASPVTSLLKDATHNPNFSNGSESQLIATPTARHTYNGLIFDPHRDVFFNDGNFLSAAGAGTDRVWFLDPNTLTLNGNDPTGWTLIAQSATHPLHASNGSTSHFIYDPGTETIQPSIWEVEQNTGDIYKFNDVTLTWSKPGFVSPSTICTSNSDMTTAFDPIHRKYYCIGGGKFNSVLVDSPFTTTNLTATGCTTPKGTQSPGFTWYGPERVFVAYAGGNTVYTYDPVADTCTPSTFTGGPTTFQSVNGTWGNFQYDPVDGVFTSCNSTTEDCFVIRLHTNAQLETDDWNFRKNQAGIIAFTAFDSFSDFTVTAGNTTGLKLSAANGTKMTQDSTRFTHPPESAHCAVPAQTGPDACGSAWLVLPSELLPPTTFYVQFRQLLDANVLAQNPTSTFFKQIIIASTFDGTCAQKEITTVNNNNKGYPTFYTACGQSAGSQVKLTGAFTGDFLNEAGDNCLTAYAPAAATNSNGVSVGTVTCNAPVDTGFNCHFQAGNNNSKSCATYPAGVWVTYYYKIQLGAFGTSTTTIQAWRALPGQPYQMWGNVFNYAIFQDPASSHGFNLIDLLNYYTNRCSSCVFGSDGFTNYDELLVSSTPIPVPAAPVN